MKDWQKNALFIVAGFVLLIIVVPLMLNWFILRERQFSIVGNATDWLQFWPVYLGAIGTLAMTIATFCTLKANQRQMASMIASEGAQLVFSLTRDYEYVFLKVTNIGRSVARNIQLSIPNNLDAIERNTGMPFGEGLIKHFNKLTPIQLLLPNQSDYIPLYMYRALADSIKDKDGVKTVDLFGDSYFPETITLIGEYFQNETFTITGSFINYLNQRHPVSQEVDNTYNVSLSDENKSIERLLRDLSRTLAGIKSELHSSELSKLNNLPTALDKVKTELHTMGDTLKKIEQKLKK